MRNISFHLTTPQFVAGTKDVTRRFGWIALKKDEVLRAVEKGQGLKRGEKVNVLGFIVAVDVRREPLLRMLMEPDYGRDECRREGFPEMEPAQFVDFFVDSHRGVEAASEITRIEFKKLPQLRKEFVMHLRHQHGAIYGHHLLDPAGQKIGSLSSFTPKPRYAEKHPANEVWTIDGQEFNDLAGFLLAYHRKLQGAAT